MSWSRYFSLVLVALVLAAGVAGAVTVSQQSTPPEGEVGTQVSATYVINELYQNPTLEAWTLQGRTALTNATWTVQLVDQAGNVVATQSSDGETVSQQVALDNGVNQVRIRLVGTVPTRSNWTYEPWQSFLFAELRQARSGGTSNVIGSWSTVYYTNDSITARRAIRQADQAVNATGNAEAEATLNNSISAYEAGNFNNAVSLAQRAEQQANRAEQRSQQMELIIYAIIALIVIGIIVGAVYWYKSQQTTSRL